MFIFSRISNKKILVCSFIIFLASLIYFTIQGLSPSYSGIIHNKSLLSDTIVSRDKYAIPRITSKNEEDAFFALGYVHAQDRLWQMQLLKRNIYGELSQLFGINTLQKDRLMRHFQFKKICKDTFLLQHLSYPRQSDHFVQQKKLESPEW